MLHLIAIVGKVLAVGFVFGFGSGFGVRSMFSQRPRDQERLTQPPSPDGSV
jgi:hypothetical protein